jgi:hypothetical protein
MSLRAILKNRFTLLDTAARCINSQPIWSTYFDLGCQLETEIFANGQRWNCVSPQKQLLSTEIAFGRSGSGGGA